MKWTVFVLLGLILAWLVAPDGQQEALARPGVVAMARVQTAPPLALPLAPAGAAPARRFERVSAQTCELFSTQGAHIASTVEEARSGAAEDVRDVCPSSEVTQVLETCSERLIQNADGMMERQYRCVQSGNCRICGEDLARRNEVLDERNN